MLSLGALLAGTFFDHSLLTAADVREKLNTPVLAVIPDGVRRRGQAKANQRKVAKENAAKAPREPKEPRRPRVRLPFSLWPAGPRPPGWSSAPAARSRSSRREGVRRVGMARMNSTLAMSRRTSP